MLRVIHRVLVTRGYGLWVVGFGFLSLRTFVPVLFDIFPECEDPSAKQVRPASQVMAFFASVGINQRDLVEMRHEFETAGVRHRDESEKFRLVSSTAIAFHDIRCNGIRSPPYLACQFKFLRCWKAC